ncbi:MAG: YbaN family protein [Dysgonomonas sp.]
MKYIYITLGTISLTFGLLGFVTPGLPVTPLILLTGFLYAKGSPRLYKKLEDHKITGRYLKKVSTGLSVKGLILSIAFMWVMISITAFVVFPYGTMRFVMLGLGVIGTVSHLIVLRRKKAPKTVLVECKDDMSTDINLDKTE